jgi:uncharacterized protein with HEPN domain
MQRDDDVYVGHMLDLSRKVASKTAGVRRAHFDRDENLRLALAHLLQTIGEAARRVSRDYQRAPPEIPWGGCCTGCRSSHHAERTQKRRCRAPAQLVS